MLRTAFKLRTRLARPFIYQNIRGMGRKERKGKERGGEGGEEKKITENTAFTYA